MRFRLLHKGLILILVPLAICLGFICSISVQLDNLGKQLDEQMRCANILAAAQTYQQAQVDSSLAIMVYMASHDPKADDAHLDAGKRLEASVARLTELYKDYPDKADLVHDMKHSTSKRWRLQRIAFDLPSQLVFRRMMDKYKESHRSYSMADVFNPGAVDRLVDSEQAVDDGAEQVRKKSMESIYSLMVGMAAFSWLFTLFMAVFFNRKFVSELKNIKHNILQIGGKGSLLPPTQAKDEIGELDTAVHRTVSQIKTLEDEKHNFIAVIAGKLKTPLDSIRGTIDRLRKHQQLDTRGLEHLNIADSSLDRLIRMVGELLHLDDLEEGKLEMTYRRVNLNDVLKASCEAVSEAAAQAQIKVETSPANLNLLADQDRLVQVIVNLLANAIKFSEPGSSVGVFASDSGNSVQIRVSDRGRGMPEEFQEKLFARFAQAFESDSANKKGFGLGLSICKTIVDQHGGTIDVRSKLGEGTTFTVTVPKEPASMSEATIEEVRIERKKKPAAGSLAKWLTTDALLWQKGLLLVGLPLVFQLGFVVSLMVLLVHANHRIDAAAHARKFYSQVQHLRRTEMELATAALYYRAVQADEMVVAYRTCKERMNRECDELVATATPGERPYAVRFKDALQALYPLTDSFLQGGFPASFGDLIANKDMAFKITSMLHDVDKLVQEIEQSQIHSSAIMVPEVTRHRIEALLIVAFGLNVLLACALLIYLNKSITRRIELVIFNTRLLSDRKPLMEPQAGHDEIASIDQSFFAGAARLMQLERFKDQLVSMVGHDIRTPLTTINGALALAGVGAFGELPAELQSEVESADTISGELITLINDLLSAEKSKVVPAATTAVAQM